LPEPQKERIKSVLKQLADSPLGYPGVIQMAGDWSGYFRIRVGQIRIIFWFDQEEDVVYVDHIGVRGDIYKR
jgi:mRNA interferase RelE/StbE